MQIFFKHELIRPKKSKKKKKRENFEIVFENAKSKYEITVK